MASNKVLKLYLSFQMDKASVDATLRDSKKIEDALENIRQEAEKTRKAYESLEDVSTRIAVVGASILTPLILSAQKYATTVGNAEATSRKWLASTKALEQSQLELGRKAAQALQPYLDLAVTLSEKLADLPPGVIQAGVAIGGGLALVGAAGLLVASIGKFGSFVREFGTYAASLQSGKAGFGGNLLASGIAVAGGVGIGLGAGKAIGKVTGDKDLEERSNLDYLINFFKQLPIVGLEALKTLTVGVGAVVGALMLADREIKEVGAKIAGNLLKIVERVKYDFDNIGAVLEAASKGIQSGVELGILSIQRFLADISIKDPTGKIIDIEFDELLGLNKHELDAQIEAAKANIDVVGQVTDAWRKNTEEYNRNLDEIDQRTDERIKNINDQTARNASILASGVEFVNAALGNMQKEIFEFAFSADNSANRIHDALQITQEALDAFADFQENEADAFRESFQRRADIATEGHEQELKIAEDFERNRIKQIEDFERQAAQAREDFARQQVQKLQDFNRQQKAELQDFQRNQLQAEQDFYTQRATEAAQFQREDLQRLEDFNIQQRRAQEDHAQKLQEAAGRLDAIAVLNELRSFNTQSKREKQDFDKETQRRNREQTERLKLEEQNFKTAQAQRAEQFQREQRDKVAQFERDRQRAIQDQARKEADSRANFERQQAEQRNQFERSLTELRQQTIKRIAEETASYNQQKQKRQQAFTEQLSQLLGFQTREKQARQAHYQILEQQLRAFINQARIGTTPPPRITSTRPGNFAGFATGGYSPGGPINTSPKEFISNPFTTHLLEGALGPLTQQKLQSVAYDNSRRNEFNISISGNGNPTDIGRAVRREIEGLLMQLGQGA